MEINNKNKLRYIYLAGFFIILALPLLNIPPWFAPPAWSEAIVFRSLLAVLFFAFLAKGKINFQKIKGIINPRAKTFLPLASLLAFLLTVFISTLFSLDIQFSLWGDPNRGGGFINFFFLILFCIFGFLIIKKEDWKKLLDFSLIIGFSIGLIAIFQQFGILNNIFVHMDSRPSSTLGNSIILALYLLPLLFLAISFFILEKNKAKKYFYLFLIIFFASSVIFITQSRAAFLGILVGLFWFLIAYPKKMRVLKIGAVILPILVFLSLLFLNSNPKVYEKLNPALSIPISRIATLTQNFGADPVRISAWKISMQAFLEKPLLGYGPENFYIAFNKHYDPNLPLEGTKDFDRAHNSLIEILIDSGVFAVIFYLVFFISLFWGLQKIKRNYPIAHGLQAGFLAYFVASLAGIESFSSFLIFFLFSAYSFHLISLNDAEITQVPEQKSLQWFSRVKIPALCILGLCLIIFLWQYNLVPFQINTQINIAQELAKEKKWQESFKILEEQSKIKTFFLPYANSVYLKLLVDRIAAHPDETNTLSKKIAEIAKNNTGLQPYNSENWLRLGESLTILAQEKNDPEIAKKAETAAQEALKLSPKDPVIFLASFMADVAVKDFRGAEDKSAYCLKTFPEIKECPWLSGLINIYSNNIEKGKDFVAKAREKGYPIESETSLSQLSLAYLENKNYKEMLPIYQKLISTNGSQAQYKTALALLYKYLGEYDKARELALEILKTNPELKNSVDEFLRTLYQ
jgi:O-antigen ligase